jgi:putative ABC transport system substrate-binding protein
MSCRTFEQFLIVVGCLLVPLLVADAHAAKLWQVGVLATVSDGERHADALRQGLHDLGYVEGENITIQWRSAGDRAEHLSELAAEFVRLKVDVIVAGSNTAIAAAHKATDSIPIVMVYASNPVSSGFVVSLARPGGNITGLTSQATDLAAKRVQLLKEAVPNLARLAILWDPLEPSRLDQVKAAESAARELGLEVQLVQLRSPDQLDETFAVITRNRSGGVLYGASVRMDAQRVGIAEHALKSRLPTICFARQYVESGCLMSYSANFVDLYRRAAYFIDKILKGAKPADVPVEQPTKFEAVVNLKTARTIGLTIPESILLRADEVIR